MTLTGIEPEGPGIDRRIFDCARCGLIETFLVKFRWRKGRLSGGPLRAGHAAH